MSEYPTELVEISRLNGDFKKNYGKLIGAYLYLRSISAVRGRPPIWTFISFVLISAGVAWLKGLSFPWRAVG